MENFAKKYRIPLLISILLLAAFFRLWQIGVIPPGLYPDEAMNGNNALEALHTGHYKVFYSENNGREGLYINLVALSLKVFGNQPGVIRLVSALFGILTVLGIYLLAKELFQKELIALFSAFFLANSFWHINFSRIGFRAIMAPAFLSFSLYFFLRAVRGSKFKKRIILISASGALLGLGLYSYIAYRVSPIIFLPFLAILIKRKNFKEIFAFIFSAFLTASPLFFYYLRHPADFFGRTSQISIFSSVSPIADFFGNALKTFGMFFWKGDANWRHNFSGAPELWWPVGIFFAIGLIIAVIRTLKKNVGEDGRAKAVFLTLLIWFAAALLPVIISNEGIPHALRSILAIPPVMILAAAGLEWILKKNKKTIAPYVLAVALFVFLPFHAFSQYFIFWANNPNTSAAFNQNYVKIGKFINTLPSDKPKYVIIGANGADVRGIPMPAQTVMFITKSFLPEWQKEKNIFYLTPEDIGKIPKGAVKIWIK